MAIKSLREFIDILEKNNWLVKIRDEVDWDLEASAIVRRAGEMRGPGVLMENTRDYPGWRYFGNGLGSWHGMALALGLPADAHPEEIEKRYLRGLEKPIKPRFVKEAPCQENVIEGDKVNLFHLPAPMVHDGDGGRYIQTGGFRITKDLDSDWTNWGMYRNMVHDERHMGGLVLPTSDMGVQYRKYLEKKQNMPFAIALSIDPVSFITSMAPVGVGIDEADVIGGMMGEPIEVVKGKTVDLMVPAHAEAILEGEVLPPDFAVDEGPFGEFTGYRTAPRMSRSVFKVNCITYRNNPIIWIANMGVPMYDGAISIGWQALIRKELRDKGIPVKAVNLAPECGATLMAIVATEVPYHGIANRIANIIYGAPALCSYINYVVVVEPDVDVYDLSQVLFVISAQCHPGRGITIRDREVTTPLNPYLSNEERKWMWGTKGLLDCTYPVHWSRKTEVPPKVSFKLMYPKEVQDRIVKDWQKWGFKTKY